MKAAHLLKFVAVMILASIMLSGCGGDDKVGGLSLALTTTDPAGDDFVVNAGATYTHPTATDLVNVPITFDTVPSGLVEKFPQTITTDSSGKAGVLLSFTQGSSPVTIVITAKTGDLQDSKSVTIPAVNTLVASPSSVDLTSITSQNVVISGGSGGGLGAVSDSPTSIDADVTDKTVTITKLPAATTGTAEVTVTETGTGANVVIPVTF